MDVAPWWTGWMEWISGWGEVGVWVGLLGRVVGTMTVLSGLEGVGDKGGKAGICFLFLFLSSFEPPK